MPTFFNIFALLLATLTAGAYWWGVDNSFFWIYWWYDILLHLLGGLIMGLWGSAVAARMGLTPRSAFTLVFAVVLSGGIVWELFEVALNLVKTEGYWLDTFSDIGNDMLGGLAAWVLYYLLYRKDVAYGK